MEKCEVAVIDLEQFTTLMALALRDLRCPERCGPVYEFIEVGARIYQEEHEWACLVRTITRVRLVKSVGERWN